MLQRGVLPGRGPHRGADGEGLGQHVRPDTEQGETGGRVTDEGEAVALNNTKLLLRPYYLKSLSGSLVLVSRYTRAASWPSELGSRRKVYLSLTEIQQNRRFTFCYLALGSTRLA